jgi:hypothetical protein
VPLHGDSVSTSIDDVSSGRVRQLSTFVTLQPCSLFPFWVEEKGFTGQGHTSTNQRDAPGLFSLNVQPEVMWGMLI